MTPTCWGLWRQFTFHTGETHLLLLRVFTGPDAEAAAKRMVPEENGKMEILAGMQIKTDDETEYRVSAAVFEVGIHRICHAALPMAHQETSVLILPGRMGN